ncbi:DUF2802 domain-containing protein [Deefgea rivuli]|uniref:DUF2802 domain-containing protein n=1 Tax=Deefgea rivuli TaxID=400948 RepID=UPI00055E7922|nr:DUF2802 domain-containing protein [Deefgea rivuli]
MVSNSGIYITWPQLLYVGILVLSFYVVELFFFWLRHGRKSKSSDGLALLQAQIDELRQELSLSKVRMAALAAQLLPSNFDENAIPPSLITTLPVEINASSAESPYAQAIRLAQQGADATEVAAVCGISRGEADLIVAIYRSAARS